MITRKREIKDTIWNQIIEGILDCLLMAIVLILAMMVTAAYGF